MIVGKFCCNGLPRKGPYCCGLPDSSFWHSLELPVLFSERASKKPSGLAGRLNWHQAKSSIQNLCGLLAHARRRL